MLVVQGFKTVRSMMKCWFRARIFGIVSLCLGLIFGLSHPVQAEDIFGPLVVTIGGIPTVVTHFGSSAHPQVGILPTLSFRSPDEKPTFSPPDDAFDVSLFSNGTFSAGPAANWRTGRTAAPTDHGRAAGWSGGPDLGIFAEAWVLPETFRLRVEVRQGLMSRAPGLVVDVSADQVWTIGSRVYSLGPRASLGNRAYFRGLEPLNAVPLQVQPGFRSIGLAGTITQHMTEQWDLLAFARVDRLIGNARTDVTTGLHRASYDLTTGIGASYSFRLDRH